MPRSCQSNRLNGSISKHDKQILLDAFEPGAGVLQLASKLGSIRPTVYGITVNPRLSATIGPARIMADK